MSSSFFRITEHVLPCQHIREYRDALNVDKLLQLAIQQYTHLNNSNPLSNPITLIAAHGNGLPKGCYEPLWDELITAMALPIKSIRITDCFHQGASGILNEVGIAYSFSCSQFFHLDVWASRVEAEEFLRKSPFFQLWESKAMEIYLQFGLRSTPTLLYPSRSFPRGVTLTTNKAQEAWTFLSLNAPPPSLNPQDSVERALGNGLSCNSAEGDFNYWGHATNCPWACLAFKFLPSVRLVVLLLFGENSHISRPLRREDKLRCIGIGLGGSGGVAMGRVRAETIQGTTHVLPIEKI
ncbi:uncharacterized protein BDR25DRAFT_311914 [Lindgomyces ingoldianus]|uniref:Uncharacterized protein n=1 Tax=Lindgomyces ingoldianus TaxID=673940 RepID=A0ACB6R3N7_9PLEO|nr:uncharacterized protein BDR25DRAFT_311914 [Lindgomyces ingoldianus]KAF2473715.1 hypothetical protein BDR25DRAFT_311914 [Lindgomyces ingoldianus]